jgi:hypothetical protein
MPQAENVRFLLEQEVVQLKINKEWMIYYRKEWINQLAIKLEDIQQLVE